MSRFSSEKFFSSITSLACLKVNLLYLREFNSVEHFKNWLLIRTIATTTVSRQNEGACRLIFTDNKPFRLLKQFLLRNCLTFRGHIKTIRRVALQKLSASRGGPGTPGTWGPPGGTEPGSARLPRTWRCPCTHPGTWAARAGSGRRDGR